MSQRITRLRPIVYLDDGTPDGVASDRLTCEKVVRRAGSEPGYAVLRASLAGRLDSDGQLLVDADGRLDTTRLGWEDVFGLDPTGGRVAMPLKVRVEYDGETVFVGRLMLARVETGRADEGVWWHALDLRDEAAHLENWVRGQVHQVEGADVQTDVPMVFNPEGVGNYDGANSSRWESGVDTNAHYFSAPRLVGSSGEELRWSVAAILQYLVGRSELGIVCPAWSSLVAMGWDEIYPADLDLEGLSWPDQLSALLDAVGYVWEVMPGAGMQDDVFLRVWSPAEPISTTTILSQQRGSAIDAELSELESLSLTWAGQRAITKLRARGSLEVVETCVTLVPGWAGDDRDRVDSDPKLALKDHPNHEEVRDVYRLWVAAEDEGGPNWDWGEALQGGGTVARRRRALPCLPSSGSLERRPMVVEGSADGITWVVLGDAWQALPDRIGVRLVGQFPPAWAIEPEGSGAEATVNWSAGDPEADGDGMSPGKRLDPRMFLGAERFGWQSIQLRVTCCVETDYRPAAEAGPTLDAWPVGTRCVELDWSGRFERWCRSETSYWADVAEADSPSGVVRDDTSAVEGQLDELLRSAECCDLSGRIGLWRIRTDVVPGVAVTSIGTSLGLQANGAPAGTAEAYPTVEAVEWQFDTARTLIHLTDGREMQA